MKIHSRLAVTECGKCEDFELPASNQGNVRCAVYQSVRRQLEECKDAIDLALKHLSRGDARNRQPTGEEDMFSYGPQGAD